MAKNGNISKEEKPKKYKRKIKISVPLKIGDNIEKLLKFFKIDKTVEFLYGKDCGCDERKKLLNEIKVFRSKKVECLEEEEFKYLSTFFTVKPRKIHPDDQRKILKIYNRVFNDTMTFTSCAPCLVDIIDKLKIVMKAYQ